MIEVLALVLAATIAVSCYAIWTSAWRSAPPSPRPSERPPYPHPLLGTSELYGGSLREISTSMQRVIFTGITTIPKEKS